jgi:hypothetical protein
MEGRTGGVWRLSEGQETPSQSRPPAGKCSLVEDVGSDVYTETFAASMTGFTGRQF